MLSELLQGVWLIVGIEIAYFLFRLIWLIEADYWYDKPKIGDTEHGV